jgi:hypothetical protein
MVQGHHLFRLGMGQVGRNRLCLLESHLYHGVRHSLLSVVEHLVDQKAALLVCVGTQDLKCLQKDPLEGP